MLIPFFTKKMRANQPIIMKIISDLYGYEYLKKKPEEIKSKKINKKIPKNKEESEVNRKQFFSLLFFQEIKKEINKFMERYL